MANRAITNICSAGSVCHSGASSQRGSLEGRIV